jgi:hypothetical protein
MILRPALRLPYPHCYFISCLTRSAYLGAVSHASCTLCTFFGPKASSLSQSAGGLACYDTLGYEDHHVRLTTLELSFVLCHGTTSAFCSFPHPPCMSGMHARCTSAKLIVLFVGNFEECGSMLLLCTMYRGFAPLLLHWLRFRLLTESSASGSCTCSVLPRVTRQVLLATSRTRREGFPP